MHCQIKITIKTMEKNYKRVGAIELNDVDNIGVVEVMVSDPCYNSDSLWSKVFEVLSGNYNCFIDKKRYNSWGLRVRSMAILHSDFDVAFLNNNGIFEGGVAVDSGTMSICDCAYYDKYHINDDDQNELNDRWYEKNVCSWACRKNYHIADKLGFISSSGFGDGMYDVFTYTNNGVVVGVEVVFIDDNEDDE